MDFRFGCLLVGLAGRDRLDRFDDLLVAGAAAQVALERVDDLVPAGMRVLLKQRRRGHQEAGRAIAALHRTELQTGFLKRVTIFDRGGIAG